MQQCLASLIKSQTLFTVEISGITCNPKIKAYKAFNYNMIYCCEKINPIKNQTVPKSNV